LPSAIPLIISQHRLYLKSNANEVKIQFITNACPVTYKFRTKWNDNLNLLQISSNLSTGNHSIFCHIARNKFTFIPLSYLKSFQTVFRMCTSRLILIRKSCSWLIISCLQINSWRRCKPYSKTPYLYTPTSSDLNLNFQSKF
jgi:hypothetical protein